eukprot:g2948.t1
MHECQGYFKPTGDDEKSDVHALRGLRDAGAFGVSFCFIFGVRAVLTRRERAGLRGRGRALLRASDMWWLLTALCQVFGCLNGVIPPKGQPFSYGQAIFVGNTALAIVHNYFGLVHLPRVIHASACERLHTNCSARAKRQRNRLHNAWCATGWLLALCLGVPVFLLGFKVRTQDPWFMETGVFALAGNASRLGLLVYCLNCFTFFAQTALLAVYWTYQCFAIVPPVREATARMVRELALDQELDPEPYRYLLRMMARQSRHWRGIHFWRLVGDIAVMLATLEGWWAYLATADAPAFAYDFQLQATLNAALATISVLIMLGAPATVNSGVAKSLQQALHSAESKAMPTTRETVLRTKAALPLPSSKPRSQSRLEQDFSQSVSVSKHVLVRMQVQTLVYEAQAAGFEVVGIRMTWGSFWSVFVYISGFVVVSQSQSQQSQSQSQSQSQCVV